MRRFQSTSLESPFTYILVLFYRLDSLSAFFQNLFQFLHGSGSQHGDSRLAEIGNALEDRGGGKVATGVQHSPCCRVFSSQFQHLKITPSFTLFRLTDFSLSST